MLSLTRPEGWALPPLATRKICLTAFRLNCVIRGEIACRSLSRRKAKGAAEDCMAAQHSVHADGWIHTAKLALCVALGFVRFVGEFTPFRPPVKRIVRR